MYPMTMEDPRSGVYVYEGISSGGVRERETVVNSSEATTTQTRVDRRVYNVATRTAAADVDDDDKEEEDHEAVNSRSQRA